MIRLLRSRVARVNARDQSGQALVLMVLALVAILLVASYAIDTSVWEVHKRHLQTEADAAALAGAADLQPSCTTGINTPGRTDYEIAQLVHTYDGTTAPALGGTGFNQQVPQTPNGSGHKLYSLINSPNFANQSQPGDSGTGSPCTDGFLDVKLTEAGLPSYFPFVNPGYINAQARVQSEGIASAVGAEPLAIPDPGRTTVQGELVDEGNNDAPLGSGLVQLTPGANNTYSASAGAINFANVTGPVGLRVESGSGPSCGTQLSCYDSGASTGITYTRVWSAGSSAPTNTNAILEDASLSPAASSGCPLTNGVFSNFVSDSTSCNVQLSATVLFPTGATCSNVSLTLNGNTSSMTCNSATVQNTGPCAPTACVATTWTSGSVSVGADNPDGPETFSLTSGQTFGMTSGKTPKACTATTCSTSFGTVQRVFNGAYDSTSAGSSRSGPIIAADVTDPSTGTELMSVQNTQTKSPTITVTLLNQGYQETAANTPLVAGANVTVLHTAGNKGTFAIECGGNNGASTFDYQLAVGCSGAFATTQQANPPICSNQPAGAAVCANQTPGTGKVIESGIDCHINGVVNTAAQSCTPSTVCNSPNYWTSPNTLGQIETESPADPRLVTILIVDNDAWVGVSGSSFQTPIRAIGTFYITGWSSTANKGADPCTSPANGTAVNSSTGLTYVKDDSAAANTLLGHFVYYDIPGGVPNGQACPTSTTSVNDCTTVLVK